MCPFLTTEARHIACTRALRGLSTAALAEAPNRAAAYATAGLGPVSTAEDREAVRRQRRYWRRTTPALVAGLADFAAGRILAKFGGADV